MSITILSFSIHSLFLFFHTPDQEIKAVNLFLALMQAVHQSAAVSPQDFHRI